MRIETEWKQRPGDGAWVLWGKIPDPHADINYWRRLNIPVPQKWVQLKVYDYLAEIV